MKKYLVASVLLGLLVAVPVLVFASTNKGNSSFWEMMVSFVGQTDNSRQTATVMSSTGATITTGATPQSPEGPGPGPRVSSDSLPPPFDCDSTLLPPGYVNDTIRCNGRSWQGDSFLRNTGYSVQIGDLYDRPNTLFEVIANNIPDNEVAIYGYSKNPVSEWGGAAVKGVSESGIGIMGSSQTGFGIYGLSTSGTGIGAYSATNKAILGMTGSGIAVAAEVGSFPPGYGFYQVGRYAKNLLEGDLSVGFSSSTVLQRNIKIKIAGGLQIFTPNNDERPECWDDSRGTFWVITGGPGERDKVTVCAKDASGAFTWREI